MPQRCYARDLRARVTRAKEQVNPTDQFTVIERAHELIEQAVGAGLPYYGARQLERSIKLRVARRWYADHGFYPVSDVRVADQEFETVYPLDWIDTCEAVLDECHKGLPAASI